MNSLKQTILNMYYEFEYFINIKTLDVIDHKMIIFILKRDLFYVVVVQQHAKYKSYTNKIKHKIPLSS